MTSKVVNVLRAGFALAAFGLGLQTFMPVIGAELDGFAINTQDKAVTVTLFTDQRANYTTEHHGKQFTIVLPQTQLSKEQLENGLPVVIDNKNRFIGRAVPTEDGKVKIILPNLPAEDYAVSIQQKRRGQSVATAKPVESLKPRPAVKAEPESHFEQVASNFPKPAAKPVQAANHLRLSPAPASQKANRGQVWNPYVYRPTDFQPVASKTVTRPIVKKAPRIAVNTPDEPVSTVSVAESVQQAFGDQNSSPQPTATGNASDPLWYLHSLPPSNAAQANGDNLQGPAAQLLPFGQTPANPVQVTEKPAPSEIKELTAEIRKGFQSLPRWLVITVAVFLGGMGLFSLIGGLVLLKLLFNQSRLSLDKTQNGLPYGVVPLYTAPDATAANNASQPGKSAYASRPGYGPTSLQFEDKASIQALDYLKNNASTVTQAVYNSSLVKFPTSSKQRSISRKKASLL